MGAWTTRSPVQRPPRVRLVVVGLLVGSVLALLGLGGGAASGAPQAVSSEPDRQRLLVRPATEQGPRFDALVEAVGAQQVGAIAGLGVRILDVPTARADEALERLSASPEVAFAELDAPVTLLERVPDDPLYSYQWGAELVDAPAAWSASVGAEDVVIAVLDTGVDDEHEDLLGGVAAGANFVDPSSPPDDDQGHGTLTAGVAAARTNNTLGVAGMCWRCTVLPVKVLDEHGEGSLSTVSAGIVYATDQGAQVINLSLGSLDRSSTLEAAVAYADQRGVLQVAAAGNSGTTDPVYPAAYEPVIGVAGVDELDRRYEWSGHGAWVDLAAPGCMYSTDFDPTRDYSWYCGTSASAPVVAGIAGLAFASDVQPTHTDVREALRAATVDVGDFVAYGRLDADATLAALGTSTSTSTDPDPDPPSSPSLDTSDGEMEPEPSPQPGTSIDRHAGSDRYETAVAISAATFDAGAQTVFLATGERFPDALAAGAVAAGIGAPVLLTQLTVLPDPVADELRRLAPERIVVVGGDAAISPEVAARAAQVSGATVYRVDGLTRYETAANVARSFFAAWTPTVYVATGETFPDALAGAPAAAGEQAPLVLTERDRLPAETRRILQDLRPDRIVVLGGPTAVSREVVDELGGLAVSVVRVAGTDRFDTATAISRRAFPDQVDVAMIATGATFPDGLAGGPAAAARGGPVLLVTRDQLPDATRQELARLSPHTLGVLGGRSAISDGTAEQAAQAASEGDPE